jgi:hypothetical protein
VILAAQPSKKENNIKEVKVFDSHTNNTSFYPSIRKATSAIKVDVKSLNRHCLLTNNLGFNTLYKNRYLIDLNSKSNKLHTLANNLSGSSIELKNLEKDKIYFFLFFF